MKRSIRRFVRQFRYGEKGFTLIELLVVVAILGVLAAVIVPNIGRFIGTGAVEAANTEAHNVQTAVTGYISENNAEWPQSSDDLGDFLEGGTANLKATYEFGGDAGIESVSAQEWEGISWNAAKQLWERS